MRFAALLIVLVAMFAAGCGEIKKDIDTPGPAPPYDPKGAALPADLMPKEPQTPADAPDDAPKDARADEPAEDSK